jgi:glucose dehydrogenase
MEWLKKKIKPSEGGMTMGKTTLAASVGLACLLCTTPVALAADPGTEDPNNWPQYHRTTNAWRYSPLDQINKDNVTKLSVAWIAHGGDITMGIQETPLAIDGVIYSITAGNRVAALDGQTGQELSATPSTASSTSWCQVAGVGRRTGVLDIQTV